jgi:hypothetical protein
VSTIDCFDIMVREQNPDDLINGVSAAETTDDKLNDGTMMYNEWNQMLSWLNTRATAAGATSLFNLLENRCVRIPESFDAYVWYPSRNSHVPAARLFLGTAQTLGTMTFGGTYATGSILPATISYNECGVIVATGTIGSGGWDLTVGATYSDATQGTETVAVSAYATGLSPAAIIGKTAVTAGASPHVSAAGQSTVFMSTTTGMAASQTVLLKDYTIPALLTDDTTASATVTIDPMQCGWYTPGDEIFLHDDDTANEPATIEQINYDFGIVTLNAPAAGTFTVANHAFIRLAAAGTRAWTETHVILSVAAATSITLTTNLQHSYFTSGYGVRLLKDVRSVTTASAGTGGDSVHIQAIPERPIVQV